MSTTSDNNSKQMASKIIGIQFSILSPEEIRKGSVAEITNRDTYINNKPIIGGLFDPRLGVLEPGLICPTDGLDYIQTPGYFGHINLARPVFYIQYLNVIIKILRCVCIKCSKLLISKDKYKEFIDLLADNRWNKIFAIASKIKRCGECTDNGCGYKQPAKIKKENLATLIAEWDNVEGLSTEENNKISIKLTPEKVIKLFRRISDDDIAFMGFSPLWSRPDWMVCQVLAIPPPAVRPSIKHDSQQRSEDDITHIIVNIIKANKTLQEKIAQNADGGIIDDWTTVLQYYIATLVDNKIPGVAAVAQRSGRPLKSIKERLNGKGGRVRGNLMGKRVDYSARSVITPDPQLSIRELGVPLKIAKNLTKPVIVNDKNKNYLLKLVRNGPDIYPGAKILEKKNGENISLRYIDKESIKLQNGDKVHRHMLNGDNILFNRQPTLHKMSMMSHVTKIMPEGDTFRMNVGDTKPYNADFDGDEMNLHLPQDDESEIELAMLAAIPYQIISPANNKSIIGIFQDSLLGCYLFTNNKKKLDMRFAMNLLMGINKVDINKLLKSGDEVTNFDIISQILPPISLEYKTKRFNDDETYATSNNVLDIKNGNYLRGHIEKGVLGDGSKGLIQRINNDYGNIASADFIDNIQNVVTEYMKYNSYSVGISDLISDDATDTAIYDVILEKKKNVQNLIDETHLGIFENKTGKSNEQEFETKVNNILNQASLEAGKIGRSSLDKDNRFVIMVNAGSKGSDLNIAQMISCLGQQNVDGKRIPYGYENRTLPHYNKFDDSPSARGFIENSFIGGLTPTELFFHAMGGRVGLIDTAVKSVTWETQVVLIENGKPLYTKIGEWIDNKMDNVDNVDNVDNKVEHYAERNLELMNTNNIYIPTTDENGVVTWGEVTAITRHDPGTKLYEIKTTGGREVIVTESKSLLIWDDKTKKLKEMLTPDIKIGDCVPVTQTLCTPPIVKEYILLSDYLPKDTYIYGTDFHKACDLMNDSMQNCEKIQHNWWDENNNKEFTLPYTNKASLQRCCVRSNISNIKLGCVYPYRAARKDTTIPEVFKLTNENGIFIGLFLAEGNIHNSHITITNNNVSIRNFVKNWFDKHSIIWNETTRKNKINGTTTSVIGNCAVLSTFIDKLVGRGAQNKFVPTEAFIAPEEFIIGILNGYFSGDGTISNNSVEASSASKRLIEGINMLCSRLGIFGKVFVTQLKSNNLGTKNILPTHRISIRAQWGKLFSEKVELLDENKNRKLGQAKWTTTHCNFPTYNDIVLDKITEINILGTENHPKMYDLTIPSTLNFGLANGLQVRDTSQTGYISRRLIKSLEDLMVHYDMTVRNNKNKIIQFSYGDDCFDPIKVEFQTIPLVQMSFEDIYNYFQISYNVKDSATLDIFTKETQKKYKQQKSALNEKNKFYIDYMKLEKVRIIDHVFKKLHNKQVHLPVAFSYIIANIVGQFELNINSQVDISPLEAYQMIEETYQYLESYSYIKPNSLFKVLYYFYLTPKQLLVIKRFNKKALTYLLDTIVKQYKQAIVNPGEMVGIIAAQSIGEPTTQLTLNSVTYDTDLIVRNKDGIIKKVQIGEFTERNINSSNKKEYYADKDTTYAEINEDDFYEIPSATEDGEITWNTIEAVTQHPVVNEDGTNTLIRVTTEHGRDVTATKAKSFLQLREGKIVGIDGKDLKVGDYLPVSRMPIDFTEVTILNLKEIFLPKEYLYTSEIMKAKKVMHEYHWWLKHNNKTFIVPYNRSDSLVEKVSNRCRKGCKTTWEFEEGCVYPFPHTGTSKSTIPEEIELDYDFGYLMGAYCAEGCITKTQISIANIEPGYFDPIERVCRKYNITTKIYRHENKGKEGWTSQDLRIYSVMMTRIVEKLGGKLSHGKFVHDRIIFSNKECLKGFLDAYIGGDGTICKKGKNISIYSVSKNLIWDVHQILNILDIYSFVRIPKKRDTPVVFPTYTTPVENIKQGYQLNITNRQAYKLASILNMKIQRKQDLLQHILTHKYNLEYCKNDLTVPNIINDKLIMEERNGRYQNIFFDKIKSIEEVPNPTKYVFDLTVEKTRNFNTYNGLNLRDTFHFAGVASKSNVTRGVPRIEEILALSDNPKNPSCTIYLPKEIEHDQHAAQKLIHTVEHTKLKDIIKTISICFDPNDLNTLIETDEVIIREYKEFSEILDECIENTNADEKQKSKWIIRMEMNETEMLDKNITMEDIHFALKYTYQNDVTCIYSDYNSDNLIFRIRLKNIIQNKKKAQQTFTLDQSDEIYILKNFQEELLNNLILRGVKNISNVLLRKISDSLEETDGNYNKKEIWVLDTVGSNLLKLLSLDNIDTNNTVTNHIQEIYRVLGIEAARQSIYNELVEVIEFDSTYINYHHLSILCDRMTCNATMVSVFRHGINNDNIGPIAKASFEETPEQFLKAARHAELDNMRGVSANVMCGQDGYFGTSSFKVLLDINEMIKNEETEKLEIKNDQELIEKEFGDILDPNDPCSINNIAMPTNIANIKSIDLGEDDDYDPF